MADDLDDPRISAYKPQRRILLPAPPGPHRKHGKAQRKARAREDARAGRLHLVGLSGAGAMIMAVVLAVVIALAVVAVISHH